MFIKTKFNKLFFYKCYIAVTALIIALSVPCALLVEAYKENGEQEIVHKEISSRIADVENCVHRHQKSLYCSAGQLGIRPDRIVNASHNFSRTADTTVKVTQGRVIIENTIAVRTITPTIEDGKILGWIESINGLAI